MSRARSSQPLTDGQADRAAAEPSSNDSASVAENIGIAALELAKRARAAGFTTIGYLLECAALEAGAKAAASKWPADASET